LTQGPITEAATSRPSVNGHFGPFDAPARTHGPTRPLLSRTAAAFFERIQLLACLGPLILSSFLLAASDLLKLDLPERDWLIDRLISTSSLSMVYAERGLGKTWFVLSLALAVVKGENFLDYQVNRPWHVLYVDGEMSLVDLQSRIKALELRACNVCAPAKRAPLQGS
jgi:hypothetical protein